MDFLKAIFGIDDRKVNLEASNAKTLKENILKGIKPPKLVSRIFNASSDETPGYSDEEMKNRNDQAEINKIIDDIKSGKYKHGSTEMAEKISRCKQLISRTIYGMNEVIHDEEIDPDTRKQIEDEEMKATHDKLTTLLEEAILANPNIDEEDKIARDEAFGKYGNKPSSENVNIISEPLHVFGEEKNNEPSIEPEIEEPAEESVSEEPEIEEPAEESVPEEPEIEEPAEESVPEKNENNEEIETTFEEDEKEVTQLNTNETLDDLTRFSSYSDYVSAYCKTKNLKNEELISFASLIAAGKTPKDLLTNEEFIKEKQRQESKKKADELELEIAKSQKRIGKLESRIAATNDDLAAAIVEGSTLKTQVQALREEKEALGEENVDIKRKAKELKEEVASLKNQLANTKKSVDEATSENLGHVKTISELKKELLDARKEVERTEKSLQSSEQQSEELRKELDEANKKIREMAANLTKQLDSIKADDDIERAALENAKNEKSSEVSKKDKKQKKAKHMASTSKHMKEETPIEESEPEKENQEEPKIDFGTDEVVIEPAPAIDPAPMESAQEEITSNETEQPVIIAKSTNPDYPGVFTQTPDGDIDFVYPSPAIADNQPQQELSESTEEPVEKAGRSR